MANGELCRVCGYQETEHDHPEYVSEHAKKKPCGHFRSEIKHWKRCPVIDCNGDCRSTIQRTAKRRAWAAECAENRVRNSWYIGRDGRVHMIDLGS
jgi:hypothetical protein